MVSIRLLRTLSQTTNGKNRNVLEISICETVRATKKVKTTSCRSGFVKRRINVLFLILGLAIRHNYIHIKQ